MRFQLAAACGIALATSGVGTLARGQGPGRMLHEVTLDIDRDGKPDRAVLLQPAGSSYVDLHIHLGPGAAPLDPSRRPSVVKTGITAEPIRAFESKGAASLVIKYGRGGSDDYEVSLTIVHRRGRLLVGGYTHDWDTRHGMGRCAINFLSGKGVASQGLAGSRPIGTQFKPIALADWSDDKLPKACRW